MSKPASEINGYPLDQSPFFKLKTRRKLAELLHYDLKKLQKIAQRSDNYRVFEISPGASKRRVIEEPQPRLLPIHKRIFQLLRRIGTPSYLHSGVKGRSYITNATAHLGATRVITLDIRKFYPSTMGWHIYEFFHEVMQCSEDVSGLITKLCVVDDHVPTGSCLSQIIAFYAHYTMFEGIAKFTNSRGLVMTCYVDDITVSGHKANGSALYNIRGFLKRRGLTSAVEKERLFEIGWPKSITGSIVVGDGIFLPNFKHEKIHSLTQRAMQMDDGPEKLRLIQSVLGMAVAGSQSDPRLNRRRSSVLREFRRLRLVVGNQE